MSDPKDHLHWCLKEDQISLQSPNEKLAENYLSKARKALEVANLLEDNEYYDWTVTASYYARYFALTALLRRCGLDVKNHACAITLLEFAFVDEGELSKDLLQSIQQGKRNRVEKQYGITETTEAVAAKERERAVDFVTELTGYLEGMSPDLVSQVREIVKDLE